MSCFNILKALGGTSKKAKNTKQTTSTNDGDVSDDDEFHCRVCERVPEKLFAAQEKSDEKLVGVVVTIFEGSSYDEMFREVRPSSVSGERVSTYSIACGDVERLHDYLVAATPVIDNTIWRSLIEDIRSVEADSVVFNWECCSGCGDHCFPGRGSANTRLRRPSLQRMTHRGASGASSGSATMRFMGLALKRGHTVMCSDFSLKSLIFEWSEEYLGPNPFVKVGEFDRKFEVQFVALDLLNANVPQQLQVVGQLCIDQGKAVIGAMGGTILYTVDPKRPKTEIYDLKVLTVVTDCDDGLQMPDDMKCSVGEGGDLRRGAAGHVALTYASGGQLVTSTGHWIELTRIDASLESVLRVAGHEFGEEEVFSMRQEYASKTNDAERYECVQKRASTMVQKSMPSRMHLKTKY